METIIQEIPGEGWHAITTAEFTPSQEIDVVTRTLAGELISTAQVWRVDADGTRRHSVGIAVLGDFHCVVETSIHTIPTRKNVVERQHANALRRLDAIKAYALDHYSLQQQETLFSLER